MAYGFKKGILNLFTWTLTLLAIVGVNSACNIVFGQPEEPETLKRYKSDYSQGTAPSIA